jgi:hypothetical protein
VSRVSQGHKRQLPVAAVVTGAQCLRLHPYLRLRCLVQHTCVQVVHGFALPFQHHEINWLEGSSLVVLLVTLYLSIFFSLPNVPLTLGGATAISAAIISINACKAMGGRAGPWEPQCKPAKGKVHGFCFLCLGLWLDKPHHA